MELMEETSGLAPQVGQAAGGLRWTEPVTQEEVVSLADAVKELCLFVQRSVAKDGPPAERKPFVPGTRSPGPGGPVGTCTYCGVKGHYRSQCADLTADLNAHRRGSRWGGMVSTGGGSGSSDGTLRRARHVRRFGPNGRRLPQEDQGEGDGGAQRFGSGQKEGNRVGQAGAGRRFSDRPQH
ncbi:hypothetical protein VP01_10881g1 [Puccinia sorghi]|uniref:CCHC-type domain-containing protein n=1 Tax=Puccinia sorghi TaxID=27349 RepID=A0A0L6VTG0_9BASI|nr:hypothetical protein VP01_10881g1 [Puccinia sorghi]